MPLLLCYDVTQWWPNTLHHYCSNVWHNSRVFKPFRLWHNSRVFKPFRPVMPENQLGGQMRNTRTNIILALQSPCLITRKADTSAFFSYLVFILATGSGSLGLGTDYWGNSGVSRDVVSVSSVSVSRRHISVLRVEHLGLESLEKWNVSVSSQSWRLNVSVSSRSWEFAKMECLGLVSVLRVTALVSARSCDLTSCGHPWGWEGWGLNSAQDPLLWQKRELTIENRCLIWSRVHLQLNVNAKVVSDAVKNGRNSKRKCKPQWRNLKSLFTGLGLIEANWHD